MPENEEPQDLRSVLSRVVDESEAEAAPAAVVTGKPVREAPLDVEPKPLSNGDDRPRAADGKFVAKDGAVVQTESAEDAGLDDGADDAPLPPAEIAPEVPSHWSQADKDLVAALPKEHQTKVVERYKAIEAGFTPKMQELAETKRQYGRAMEIFQPHLQGLHQQGRTPSDVIAGWAAIEQDMMQGRQQAQQGGVNEAGARHVARMINLYGIDPGRVAALLRGEQPQGDMGSAAQPPAAIPPHLLQELNTLRTQVNDITTGAQAARESEMAAQIDAFANEKDEATGQLKHPYFSELERDMMAAAQIEISQGKRPSIADLYDHAVYANRETRSKLLAANSAEVGRKAAAERKARAEAATRAASSVAGSPGSGGSPAERRETRSLRQEIAEAAAELETG